MPINLLPDQEKKENKDKNKTPSRVEFTLPEREGKKKAFREGGALEFFKIFRKKPEPLPPVEEEAQQAKGLSSFISESHKERQRPVIYEYTKPRQETPPQAEQKPRSPFPAFLSGKKPETDVQKQPAPEPPKSADRLFGQRATPAGPGLPSQQMTEPQDIFSREEREVQPFTTRPSEQRTIQQPPEPVEEKKPFFAAIPKFFRKVLRKQETTAEPLANGLPTGELPNMPPVSAESKQQTQQPTMLKRPLDQFLETKLGFDVNLLPEELIERTAPKRNLLILGITGAVALVIVLLVHFGLSLYESKIVANVEKVSAQISDVDAQIASYRDFQRKAAALKQESDAVKQLLDQHVYWTDFFQVLEEKTNQDIYFTSLAADVGGKITLTAVAKDYEAASRQLVTFQRARDFVQDVNISSMKMVEEKYTIPETGEELTVSAVTFNVSLAVLPEIFYRKTKTT